MGNPRSFTTKFNANKTALEAFVKARAGRSTTKRKEAMMLAAMGRPADLSQQARVSISLRRIAGPKRSPARLRPTSPDGRG